MALKNRNLIRSRKFEHIQANQISGIGIPGLTALTLAEGTPNTWTIGVNTGSAALGGGVAGVALENVDSTNQLGLKMSTNGNAVYHDWLVPADLDQAYPVNIRLNWTTESTTLTDGALFTVTRKAMTRNTTALSATVSTALDTAIAADVVPVATAYALITTNKGVISANSLTAGEHQLLKIVMTTKTGATNIWLLGVEIEYVPVYSGQDGEGGIVAESAWA